MRRLREQFGDTLVVIGVHSPKFLAEQGTHGLREAVLRLGIEHPVVNDAAHDAWQQYAIRAWPTVVLIDPLGYVVFVQPGEILAAELAPRITDLIARHEAEGQLNPTALDLRREQSAAAAGLFRYPSKLLLDGARLFVANTGHHQVLELELLEGGRSARLRRSFGNGEAGLRDGTSDQAAFVSPRGLALYESALYVADSENHAVRVIDLESGLVRTIAGTGEKAHGDYELGPATSTPLRSPWGLLAIDQVLFIAMAGSHQIWVLVDEQQLGVFAGNGYEALIDGSLAQAGFNQPSDLAYAGGYLFVADAEASAVRAIRLEGEPEVVTLLGLGLFEFGDRDGVGEEVRLQHPMGIAAAWDERDQLALFIADTYNSKVKLLDPARGLVTTLIGSGGSGKTDGPFALAELAEPEGLAVGEGLLYIADTNNHCIRVADLAAGELATLHITRNS